MFACVVGVEGPVLLAIVGSVAVAAGERSAAGRNTASVMSQPLLSRTNILLF